MRIRHGILGLLLIAAASACSDDDAQQPDACDQACSKLDVCSMQVPCGGVELPHRDCVSACQKRNAQGAANCVLQVQGCDIGKMASCRSQMPCN